MPPSACAARKRARAAMTTGRPAVRGSPPRGAHPRVECLRAEGEPAGERLAPGDAGGLTHDARSRAALPIRPAIAAMVKLGLGPTAPGMIEPSATNSPGYPNTSPW